MKRCALLLAVVGVLGVLAWGQSAPVPKAQASKPIPLALKLQERVKFNGFQADPKVTLQEALDDLADQHGVTFDVNEAAFKAEQIEDVLNTPIAEKPMMPRNSVRLREVLRKVLSRIPGQSGATYIIRPDFIEITTMDQVRREVWGDRHIGPFLPLVQANFEKRQLDEALSDLAEQSDYSIVVDARVAEKTRGPVTARLSNMPLDTAVSLLADMADLKSFLVDNVLYVTTKANAAQLEKQEKVRIEEDPNSGPRVGAGRFVPGNGSSGM